MTKPFRVESTPGTDPGEPLAELKRTSAQIGDILASRFERDLKRARRRRIVSFVVVFVVAYAAILGAIWFYAWAMA